MNESSFDKNMEGILHLIKTWKEFIIEWQLSIFFHYRLYVLPAFMILFDIIDIGNK